MSPISNAGSVFPQRRRLIERRIPRDGPMPRQPRYPYQATPYAPISGGMDLDLTDDEKAALIGSASF
jgi:hypothetical protein